MAAEICIFLSAVSIEFRSYCASLRRYLQRPDVTVKVQEDFIATGTETPDLLDTYIRRCAVVIHLVGDMTGRRRSRRRFALSDAFIRTLPTVCR